MKEEEWRVRDREELRYRGVENGEELENLKKGKERSRSHISRAL